MSKKSNIFFLIFLFIFILSLLLIPIKKDTENSNNIEPIPEFNEYSKNLVIHKGENFYNKLKQLNFSNKQILYFTKIFKKNGLNPTRFLPKTEIKIFFDNDKPFSFEITIPKDEHFYFLDLTDNNKWQLSSYTIPYTTEYLLKTFTIKSSLYDAFREGNEGYNLLYNIVEVLKWDINFFKDIQKGDQIRVIFEKKISPENKVSYGKILAVYYHGKKVNVKLFYFKHNNFSGYYTESGNSSKKIFLKYPLKFTRISSYYTNRRYHPILHIWRPHHGIDYAAPMGTPVHSIGDGYIERIGWAGGAGKSIRIRHANGYVSIYNHLSRYARGMRRGKRVKMGQLIGYVGMTGLATGPHLDFRIKHYGHWVNPLKLKIPKGKPLPKKYRSLFKKIIDVLNPLLEDGKNQNLNNLNLLAYYH